MKGFHVTLDQVGVWNHEIIIDGFLFFWDADTTYMVIHNPPAKEQCGGIVPYSKRSIQDHVQFINENNVEHLVISRSNIEFLRVCPG